MALLGRRAHTQPMSASEAEQSREVAAIFAAMFDQLAPTYDQSGVPFFTTIAEGLVDRLRPAPGERALDLGFGRGAATFPLADAVGPTGRVDGLDIAPTMVELASTTARERGLDHVRLSVGDAADPALPPASYDVLASSLVLFFLPDPQAALARWRTLLVPGGRLGFATFQPWPAGWQAIEDIFRDYLLPDAPTTTQMPEVFSRDETVEELVVNAGFGDVRTEAATYPIPFADVEQWRVWSRGTAMRGLWMLAPESAHPEIVRRVGAHLSEAGGSLDVAVRYTFGRA